MPGANTERIKADKFVSFNQENTRIEYVDIFRAFGIILMVMGHIGYGSKFDHFIHAFHMPMFFFVSGFLYKSSGISFGKYLIKKAKTLLLPYVVFGTIHYLISSYLDRSFSLEPVKAFLLFPTEGIPIAGALWFLIALFFSSIIYFWVDKILHNGLKTIIIITIALTGQLVPNFFGVSIPFALSAALVGVGLLHAGRIVRKYEKKLISLEWYQVLFLGIIISASIMLSGYINMRVERYPRSFLVFWINAIAASVIGMNLARISKSILKDCFLSKYIQSIGRNSIVYVCLNQLVILVIQKAIVRIPISIPLPK